jgi:hypothetical protein
MSIFFWNYLLLGWSRNSRNFCGSKGHVFAVDCVWNVMARAQKPDFVFQRNGRVHLNRRGASFQSTTGSRGVRISGSNAGYTMFRDSVKSTGYPLHSPVSASFPLPCVTVCHHISTGLYKPSHPTVKVNLKVIVPSGINYSNYPLFSSSTAVIL